jgi:outer membrane protein
MKIIIITFLFIFNFLSFEKINAAETLISYLDLDVIVSKSLAGKDINVQINDLKKKNNKIINDAEKNLLQKEKLIISQKNVLEKKEYDSKVASFKNEVKLHNQKKNNLIREVNTKKIKATTKLLDSLNPILANYSKEKSLSMIIQKKNIIIGQSQLDITDDIMKLLNGKIKKININ